MVTNMLYKYTPALVREWQIPAGTQSGAAVLSESNQPGVTITARGDSLAPIKFVGIDNPDAAGGTIKQPNGGIGNRFDSAVCATDGTFVFPVTGASATTKKNALVYAVKDGDGKVTSLALTGTVKFGVVDSYPGKATAARTAVKIGVFA